MEAEVLHKTYHVTHVIYLTHDTVSDPAKGIFQMSFTPRLRVKKQVSRGGIGWRRWREHILLPVVWNGEMEVPPTLLRQSGNLMLRPCFHD